MQTTVTPAPTCHCGAPVDPDLIELAALFPSSIKADMCAACSDREAARQAEAASRAVARQESEAREARVVETIPPEIRRTDIAHPRFNAGLWLRIETWNPADLRWLGITGGPGTSKTRCLGLLAARLIREGRHVTWTTAMEFQDRVDDLRLSDRAVSGAARAYLERCRRASILVFDDFGKNTWNASIERHLFSLIDHRKTYDLPVLWSSNTSLREIFRTENLSTDRGGPLIGRMIEASRIETT